MDFDNDEHDVEIENKEIAAQVFDTICTTLAEVGNKTEVDTSEKLLALWLKVARVVAETGDDDQENLMSMIKDLRN